MLVLFWLERLNRELIREIVVVAAVFSSLAS